MQPDDVDLWYFKLTLYDLTALGCNNIEIRKSEFVAKTQFLCQDSLNSVKKMPLKVPVEPK